MALPTINTFFTDRDSIGLYWRSSPTSNIRKWNLYGSATVPINLNDPIKGVDLSSFTLVTGGIANCEVPLTPGSVYHLVSREDLGIEVGDTYYFYITSIDSEGNESDPEVSNLHATPYGDDSYVDEAGLPVNIQYKNMELSLSQTSAWDKDRLLDIIGLLGRPAKSIRIEVVSGSGDPQIRLNSFSSDPITLYVADDSPMLLGRGEILVSKIWFNKSTAGTCLIKLFVAG